MLDLICRRYPGRRPSDYLEIDDPFTAIQVDYAVAFKHLDLDEKHDKSKLDYLIAVIKPIGTALGVTYEEKKTEPQVVPDDLPVEAVTAMFGGKGVEIKRNGRK